MAYTNVSDDYKNAIKSNAVIGTAKITIINNNGENTVLDSDILQEVTLKDYCYDEQNGNLIGTTMAKEVEITLINKDKNLDLADKEFLLELGLVLDVDNEIREFIPIGNFIVDSYEDLKSNNKYKLVAYDYMTKLNTEYKVDEGLYPCTLKTLYYNLCIQYGINYVEQTLPNENFEVTVATAPYLENMTGRSVLSAMAQLFGRFAKINRNNQMEMFLTNETDEVVDGYSMNTKLSMNKKYGPVNVVSLELGNGVEGENVTKQDDESITANGEITIRITDNPFVYSEDLREKAIDELFNAVKGLEYTPVEFNLKGRAYQDCGDIITVEDVSTGETAKTIYLNGTIKVPSLRSSTISAKALTNTAIKQKYISKSKQANTKTELMVNKHEQEISSLISDVRDDDGIVNVNYTKILQNINSIVNAIQNSGGNNLLLNSVMFAYDTKGIPEEWSISEEGILQIQSDANSLNQGCISGHSFTLLGKTVAQTVRVTTSNSTDSNKIYYTFNCKVKKDATGTCYIKVYNDQEEYIKEFTAGESANYQDITFESLLPKNNYYIIELYGSEDSNATFTDVMFSIGQYKTQWTQASGEVMNTQVNININGVTVKSSVYQGDYTVMSPLEFAGYSNINGTTTKIFTLNRDTTEVLKLKAQEEIRMSPIKILPYNTSSTNGWAFVSIV